MTWHSWLTSWLRSLEQPAVYVQVVTATVQGRRVKCWAFFRGDTVTLTPWMDRRAGWVRMGVN